MILDAKEVLRVLEEYEKDLFEEHIKLVMAKTYGGETNITAAKVLAVREIRDRLGIPEIKA